MLSERTLEIAPAKSEIDYEQVRGLITELSDWDELRTKQLGLDAEEMSAFYYRAEEALPGAYAPPEGYLLLARVSGKTAGCCAYRRLAEGICEMKHMYIRPEFRGMHVARGLAETLMQKARAAGYDVMRLETTTFMEAALALYASMGFQRREAYYAIPASLLPVTVFMELDLAHMK